MNWKRIRNRNFNEERMYEMDIEKLIQKYRRKLADVDLQQCALKLDSTRGECEIVIKALEKQIPMKAKPHKKIRGICICPICKADLCTSNDDEQIYCPDCGQALIV
jgi:hypothetical protein